MSELQAYGFAFITPLIVRSLVPPKRFYPILLTVDNAKQIKEAVESAKNHCGGFRKPVVLAGSIDILQTYLKQYPAADARVLLFDFPGLLNPFYGKHLKWLDCDHQAGGSWQIARFSPEAFESLMTVLCPLDQKGREFFLSIKRIVPNDKRLTDIEGFTEALPKTYKDLLSNLTAEDGNAEKKATAEKKRVSGALRSLMIVTVEKIPLTQRTRFVEIVLDYQLSLITKRDFINRITAEVGPSIKDDALAIRKWIDSKSGAALYDAYIDFVLNNNNTWVGVLEAHKRILEEDLILLVARQPRTVETITRYSGVQHEGEISIISDMPKIDALSKIFGLNPAV